MYLRAWVWGKRKRARSWEIGSRGKSVRPARAFGSQAVCVVARMIDIIKEMLPNQHTVPSGGRPRISFTEQQWEEFDKLLQFHATLFEVAGWFGVEEETILSILVREKGCTFSEYAKRQAGSGNASLRRAMWDNAIAKGHPIMQIWLSKQHLGMQDEVAIAPSDSLVQWLAEVKRVRALESQPVPKLLPIGKRQIAEVVNGEVVDNKTDSSDTKSLT